MHEPFGVVWLHICKPAEFRVKQKAERTIKFPKNYSINAEKPSVWFAVSMAATFCVWLTPSFGVARLTQASSNLST